MEEIRPIKLEEQEVLDTHIFRRSIVPLIFRLIVINIIWFFFYLVFNFLIFELRNSLNITSFFAVNIIFLLFSQLSFGGFSLFISLEWLGEVYIIKLPDVTIRKGFIQVEEKSYEISPADDITVRQGPMGKMFNYGTVEFEEMKGMKLYDMPDPHHLAEIFKKKPE